MVGPVTPHQTDMRGIQNPLSEMCLCKDKTDYGEVQGLSVFLMSLRAQRGNLVAVAMMVPRHVLNLNEIATLRSQ